MPERFHPAQPPLWQLLGCGGAPLAGDVEPAMRTGPDPGIFLRAPVDEIMPALAPRPRVVGNLIGGKARGRANVLRRVIERAGGIVVWDQELAGRMQRGKRRFLLDRELVEREVFAGLFGRALEFGRPGSRRLSRTRVDQIERIALEGGPRDRHCLERLLCGMQSPERFEGRIIERLNAQRDAIDASRAKAAKARRLEAQ